MLYRCLRVKTTGQWVNVLLTVAGDKFSTESTKHRAHVADALGVPRTSLEVVDGDSDRRSGELLSLPQEPEPPCRLQELTAIPRSEWTNDQMRELIELLAYEVKR